MGAFVLAPLPEWMVEALWHPLGTLLDESVRTASLFTYQALHTLPLELGAPERLRCLSSKLLCYLQRHHLEDRTPERPPGRPSSRN